MATCEFCSSQFHKKNQEKFCSTSCKDLSYKSKRKSKVASVGDRFYSEKYGWYEVIRYRSVNDIDVIFDKTLNVCSVTSSNAIRLSVKDRLHPICCDVGFIGAGEYNSKTEVCGVRPYVVWRHMIKRCYDKSSRVYQSYGMKGVSVCENWHNFQNFAEWYCNNYPKDGKKYELDKDKLFKGNMLYSPGTCCFISKSENCGIGKNTKVKLEDDSGGIFEFESIMEACDKLGLNRVGLSKLVNGHIKKYRGYKLC